VADMAVTCLNEKAKKQVEPLARELESLFFMSLDVGVSVQTEAVSERMELGNGGNWIFLSSPSGTGVPH
jgi:enoyl-[acyl-carrier-protein] reductase (NADH)